MRLSFGVVYLAWGVHFFSLHLACPGYIADSAWATAINFLAKPMRTSGRIGFGQKVTRKDSVQENNLGGTFSRGLHFRTSVCFDAFRFYS